MSTKFSIRPAPRKKPWICKRSPPCLTPSPIPRTFIATFTLKRTWPPPPGPSYGGTFLLYYQWLGSWKGSWTSPPSNGFTAEFLQHQITGYTRVLTDWDLNHSIDWGFWEPKTTHLYPGIYYESWNVQPTFFRWSGQLLVTD